MEDIMDDTMRDKMREIAFKLAKEIQIMSWIGGDDTVPDDKLIMCVTNIVNMNPLGRLDRTDYTKESEREKLIKDILDVCTIYDAKAFCQLSEAGKDTDEYENGIIDAAPQDRFHWVVATACA